VKGGPSVLPGLKHVELERDSLNPRGVKAGPGILPGLKHVELERDSLNPRGVKVDWAHRLDANTLGLDVLEVIKRSRRVAKT